MKNFSQTIIDGEKYISSKQAAKLTDYTSDYIGQLCRQQKIKSIRVGRDWLVSEKNILEYRGILSSADVVFEKPISENYKRDKYTKKFSSKKYQGLSMYYNLE